MLNIRIGDEGPEPAEAAQAPADPPYLNRKFLGVHFVECQSYGRMYPNPTRTHYVGRCPKCGQPVRARIGAHGTDARFFRASCSRHQKGQTEPCWPMH